MRNWFAGMGLWLMGAFALTVPASAKPMSSAEIKSLQSQLKDVAYLGVDFTQTQYKALRNKKRLSEGEAAFARPNKFSWKLMAPKREEWIYDGKTLVNYLPDKKTATRYGSTADRARELNEIVNLVLNPETLTKRYDIVTADRTGDVATLELKPKQPVGEIETVNLSVSTTNHLISSVKMNFHGGNYTLLSFVNPRRTPTTQNEFSFSPAAGVKINDIK